MTPKNINTIVQFLEGLQEQMQDGETACKVYVTYFELCQALAATGEYDRTGYKYAEVTDEDRREKYSLDYRNSKEEFLYEFKD